MPKKRKIPAEELKSMSRERLVSTSHELSDPPAAWRTRNRQKVVDGADAHTLKFNGWYKTADPKSRELEPMPKTLGHMTVKWGRGNNALYSDYRGGKSKETIKLDPPVRDKRDNSLISEKESQHLDFKTHTPSEHATSLVGRINDTNTNFRHNVRYAMRVNVSTDELGKLHSELSEMEKAGNYGLLKEMDSESKRMMRCMTPIEVLAKIKDPTFKFSEGAIHPHQYMEEFANRFPDVASERHFRAYSGKSLEESPEERSRIDASSLAKVPRRPTVKMPKKSD